MQRISDLLLYGTSGLIAGAIIGGFSGFAIGHLRGDNPSDTLLAAAVSVGLIGLFGGAVGGILGGKDLWSITLFGALFGALLGALGGDSLGADSWLLQNFRSLGDERLVEFANNYVGTIGGAGASIGMVVGIIVSAVIDTFRGEKSFYNALGGLIVFSIVGVIVASIGGIDEGGAAAIGGTIGVILGAIFGNDEKRESEKADDAPEKPKTVDRKPEDYF